MWVHQKDYESVGEVLAEARIEANLTQKQLAQKLRKPQSFVSNFESGQRRVDILELVRIADALGCDPQQLLSSMLVCLGAAKPRSKRKAPLSK